MMTGNFNIDRAAPRSHHTSINAARTCAAACVVAAALLAGAGEARADTRPYVVFVRGFQPPPGGDSFAPLGMQPVRDYLADYDAEIRSVTWNCFVDGAAQNTCGPLNDAQFLQDLGNAVNALPLERPVILIGHSFGGDSLLKAVNGAQGITNKINRPITALITLDPVGFGGQRLTVNGFYNPVPSRVGSFFNRWQRNDTPPLNFGDSGFISCSAGACSQSEQAMQRSCSGATLTDVYQPPKAPCPSGVPPWLCPGAPPAITIDRKSTHGSLVDDAFINRQIIEQLHALLSPRSAAVTFFNRKLGRFVVAEGGGGGPVLVNRTAAGPWETFNATDLNGGVWNTADPVNLESSNGRFVSAQPDGSVVADRSQAFEWEDFKVLKAAGGTMTSGSIVYLEDHFGATSPPRKISASSVYRPRAA
jgi:hypothetical protein